MKKYFYSLSKKLTYSIILWLVVAISVTGLMLNVSWQLENGGVKINSAGSLRKRVYHLLTLSILKEGKAELYAEDKHFRDILLSLKKPDISWLYKTPPEFYQQLENIEKAYQHFKQEAFNLLNNQRDSKEEGQKLLVYSDQLVAQIDGMVKTIEYDNTYKIELFRTFQYLLVFMAIFSAFVSIYWLNRLVIYPLKIISNGINRISDGELAVQIQTNSNNEFDIVADGFNNMSKHLDDLYKNLEYKVNDQTYKLHNKNLEISILYEVTAYLYESQAKEDFVEGFLRLVVNLYQLAAGSIELLHDGNNYFSLSSEKAEPQQLNDFSHKMLEFCVNKQSIPADNDDELLETKKVVYRFAIKYLDKIFGTMTLYATQQKYLTESEEKIIRLLADQFAVAIEHRRLASISNQLAVLEERNFMAQGLHDSIAQSLSFLNMQLKMLDASIKNKEEQRVNQHLDFIQQGINQSYDDIRELLIHYRTKIDIEDFKNSILTVINRFENQTQIPVELTYHSTLVNKEPTLEQQLQIIFILQEALSNIRKYAQAETVIVEINYDSERFSIKIIDNGIGFDVQQLKNRKDQHHYGIEIMNERAQKVNGVLLINSVINKGSVVSLEIPL